MSYAREDTAFRDELVAALAEQEVDAWVDEGDIPPSAKWMGEINHGIENTDAFVAVVSPDSADSRVCGEEVRHADQLGKPILPIVRREATETIPEIADRNWIFWRSDDERSAALEKITEALTIDPDWAKQHQSLLNDALDWDRNDRDHNRVARGAALTAAEAALTINRKRGQPQATELMREYVRAGRSEASRRQRRAITMALGVAVVSLALAAAAFWQFQRANAERERAEEQLALASSRALAAQALQLRSFRADDLAIMLSAEAASRAPTAEARDALIQTLPIEGLVELRSPERADAAVDRVASSDGRFAVSDSGRLLTDVTTGDTQTLIDDPDPFAVFLRDVVFSPDGSRLVVTNLGEFRFDVYELGQGLPAPLVYSVQAPPGERVFGGALDRSNELIAVTVEEEDLADGTFESIGLTVSVWDENGVEVLEAQVEEALDAEFDLDEAMVRVSSDGEIGAIATQWGEAQLFSVRTAQLIGFTLPVECSPSCGVGDDRSAELTNANLSDAELTTIDSAGVARTFDLNIDRWISIACNSTESRPTPEQWERFVGADVEYAPVCDRVERQDASSN